MEQSIDMRVRLRDMINVQSIEFHTGSREELLPDFKNDFPYIASKVDLSKYIGRFVPWHWHRNTIHPTGKYSFLPEAAVW